MQDLGKWCNVRNCIWSSWVKATAAQRLDSELKIALKWNYRFVWGTEVLYRQLEMGIMGYVKNQGFVYEDIIMRYCGWKWGMRGQSVWLHTHMHANPHTCMHTHSPTPWHSTDYSLPRHDEYPTHIATEETKRAARMKLTQEEDVSSKGFDCL